MAYFGSSVIVGAEGYEEYSKTIGELDINSLREGRFGFFQINSEGCKARTDYLGQEIIFYFFDGKNWAVSNSFIVLASYLYDQGVSMNVNYETINLWSIPASVTQGLVSNETFIKEIQVLPADIILSFVPNGMGWSIRKDRDNGAVIADTTSSNDYEQLLINFASKMASRSRALLESYGDRAKVDITGGLDSRLVLGVLAASGYPLDRLNFHSNRQYIDDYVAAEGLAKALGFKINNKYIETARASSETAYELWKAGCVGVYSPVYSPLGKEMQTSLHFHGACGECFRDYYKISPVELCHQVDKIAPNREASLAFSRQLGKSMDAMGFDFYSKDGMNAHYLNFRSRSHFGRSAYKNLSHVLVTPLASPDLFSAFRYLNRSEVEGSQLALDVLLLTCPELATLPFDSESKRFKKNAISNSPFFNRKKVNLDIDESIRVFRGDKEFRKQDFSNDVSFADRFLHGVEESRDLVLSTGVFSNQDIDLAIEKINLGSRLTIDGISASHIISVAEVAKVASFGANGYAFQPKKNSGGMVVEVQINQDVIYAYIKNLDSFVENFEYAFYLMDGANRVDVSWYKREPYFEFPLKPGMFSGKPSIIGFRRKLRDNSSKIFKKVEFYI